MAANGTSGIPGRAGPVTIRQMKDYREHLVITVAEAAEWLRTSEEAILKLAEDGTIPAVRYTPDDPPVFRPEDIVAFVERQSGSQQPSGLFGAGYRFAPMDVRGVPMPPAPPVPPTPRAAPAPPVPPTPPRASVFAFAPEAAQQAYEYSFSTHDTESAEADLMRAQADLMRQQAESLRQEHESLSGEMEKLRAELRKLHAERDR